MTSENSKIGAVRVLYEDADVVVVESLEEPQKHLRREVLAGLGILLLGGAAEYVAWRMRRLEDERLEYLRRLNGGAL